MELPQPQLAFNPSMHELGDGSAAAVDTSTLHI